MRKSVFFHPLTLLPAGIVAAVLSLGPAGASEFAWISKLDSGQAFEAGQVVGLFGNGLSLSTAGADQVLIVGTAEPRPSSSAGDVPVTLGGQVQLRVFGPVRAGDLVFASGRNDGTAAGLSPSEITPAKLRLLVGRTLESHPVRGVGTVAALVGLSDWEALVGLLEARDALLEAQESELAVLRSKVSSLDALVAEVAKLRRATSVLEALEAARKPEELAPLPLDSDQ